MPFSANTRITRDFHLPPKAVSPYSKGQRISFSNFGVYMPSFPPFSLLPNYKRNLEFSSCYEIYEWLINFLYVPLPKFWRYTERVLDREPIHKTEVRTMNVKAYLKITMKIA